MFALLPVLAPMLSKSGSVRANPENAERLLRQGELLGVFPEGVKGVGKHFRERYKLARFGRGGFVRIALRTGAPIIPCAVVGAEEIHPVIGKADWVGRPFGLPYFPLTPTFPWLGPLGVVPLPTKWSIDFGEPIDLERLRPRGGGGPDPGEPDRGERARDDPADGRRPPRAPPLGLVRLGVPSFASSRSRAESSGAREARAVRPRRGKRRGTRRGSARAIPCLANSRCWRAAVLRKNASAVR